jgi:hypothetical protein
LHTLDFAVQGTARIVNALQSTPCQRFLQADVSLHFEFAVTRPGFLYLSMRNTGATYGEVSLHPSPQTSIGAGLTHSGYGLSFNETLRIPLAAGTYSGVLHGSAASYATSAADHAGTTTVHGSFTEAGASTRGAAGKGLKYATLAGARSCADHSVAASVTDRRHRARHIKTISVLVNGQRVQKVGSPRRGAVLTIPVSDDVAADVRVEVTLRPSVKGRRGKVLTTSAAYEACA